ncbi:pilx9 protein [Salmonella enterica subsp. enterica serovar Typhimurium]|nr:pilx9 protein [Salmonella enterica subsp. enterica serovar Typhimurium]
MKMNKGALIMALLMAAHVCNACCSSFQAVALTHAIR